MSIHCSKGNTAVLKRNYGGDAIHDERKNRR